MVLEQGFDLPVPPDRAWPAFADIELLVSCLPGAALTGPAVDGEWPLRFDVKLGPISAGFVGSGRATADDAARRGSFQGSAVDKRSQSRVKGAVAFSVTAAGTGSRVQVEVDYTLTGTLAQFSRGGLVRDLAAALTAQFAANLSARLQPVAAATASAAVPAVHPLLPTADAPAWLPQFDPAPLVPACVPTPQPTAAAPARPAAAQPLSATSLLWAVAKARWRRLIDRALRRHTA